MSGFGLLVFFGVLATGLLFWLLALGLVLVGLVRGAVCLWRSIQARAVVARLG
ncbi:hypothetical protein ACFWCB_26210 [Streptomyces sp. NPDC060048]|uniref:hypothetical protein n=1 Tax=unclassified Streptomyces TaxID=2593676 RepID=UPI0036CA2E3E